ncbi:LOW QUALITY PROTEIN: uncharacterized protein LOC129220670 [Uloborus diversus]|uniref:LOW QUALITY PROTEIN: uncharacterized protein LOC129220670 n=1 Tax=Uloborus diversus TaxID=327109 RepID=UPI0024099D41|nr:LOW QUALITY PROTEIN: uncharacterized protein LOC129220670 [Uloborus diversus]
MLNMERCTIKRTQIVDGLRIPSAFSPETFRSALKYQPRDDDVFIVTFPKCGTTWAQQIITLIFRQGVPASAEEMGEITPFLELKGAKAAEDMPRPGAIKTHLLYHLCPWSSKAKYIFIARNPKDCCVSFYHHMRSHRFEGSFDDFFEIFLSGETLFGDYFDHLLSWYQHRNDPNVFFTTYEYMKVDVKRAILEMASFLDDKLYAEPLRSGAEKLEKVVKYSSFEYMSSIYNQTETQSTDIPQQSKTKVSDGEQKCNSESNTNGADDTERMRPRNFIRKGVTGDWKNYFSDEQSRRLDEKAAMRLNDTELLLQWKEHTLTMAETPGAPLSQIVEGLRIPAMFSADAFRSGMHYKPRNDDVIIVTYPKCGTTWTQHIVDLIYRHGEKPTSSLVTHVTPFLDVAGAEGAEKVPRPGPLKCHYPFHMVPWSDDAKYIYVTRNPKDACVSFYHHTKNIPGHAFAEDFNTFFEIFIAGKADYGDYFDHLLEWYKHRDLPNVLFMTYEEMKQDIKAAILKIASFMDDKLYAEPLRNDPEKLENVVKYSSVKHMKETVNKAMDEMFNMPKEEILKSNMPEPMKKLIASQKTDEKRKPNPSNFVRKGIVGDWRNHFSEEQSKRMDEKFAERTKGTEIANWWKEYM